jgi:hypothetical protein
VLLVAACALAASCRSKDDDAPVVAGVPELQVDLPSVWFDTVDSASKPVLVSFTNVGNGPISALATAIHGDVDQFSISTDSCARHALPPHQSCTVGVALNSDRPGSYDGELLVTPSGLPSISVDLHGKVTPALLELVASPSTADVVQGASAKLTLTLRNTGGATSGPVTLSVDAGLSLTAACQGQTLAGGEKCSVYVLYQAPATGYPVVSPTVVASADPGGRQTAPLTIYVVQPVVLSAFYDILLTGHSGDESLYVDNFLDQPVTWTQTIFTWDAGANDGACQTISDPCTNVALPANGYCSIKQRCTARSSGANGGSVAISNATGTVAKSNFSVFGADAIVRASYIGTGEGEVDAAAPASSVGATGTVFGFVGLAPLAVTLTAIPKTGSVFVGWTGACTGAATSCTLSLALASDTAVQARFETSP